MKCPNCNQEPTSLFKFFFRFSINIECAKCGAKLKANSILRRIYYGYFMSALIIALGMIILDDVYNWEYVTGLLIIVVAVIILAIPVEIIAQKYGQYEVSYEPPVSTRKRKIFSMLKFSFFVICIIIIVESIFIIPLVDDIGECYTEGSTRFAQVMDKLKAENWSHEEKCLFLKDNFDAITLCIEKAEDKGGILSSLVTKPITFFWPQGKDQKYFKFKNRINLYCAEYPHTLVD